MEENGGKLREKRVNFSKSGGKRKTNSEERTIYRAELSQIGGKVEEIRGISRNI